MEKGNPTQHSGKPDPEKLQRICSHHPTGGLFLMDSKYVTVKKKVGAKHIALHMYDSMMERIGKDWK